MKLEMAAPLRVELQAYGRQRRAALTEIYKQQRTSLRQPFLSGREFQIWLPLLLHARLIAGEGGEAGKKFESEFIDTVKGFVGAKVTMVADDDWRLAEALEVMEAVEARLEMLLEVKQDYPDNWEQKDTNKNAASDLVADLLKKETLGRLPRRRAKRPE